MFRVIPSQRKTFYNLHIPIFPPSFEINPSSPPSSENGNFHLDDCRRATIKNRFLRILIISKQWVSYLSLEEEIAYNRRIDTAKRQYDVLHNFFLLFFFLVSIFHLTRHTTKIPSTGNEWIGVAFVFKRFKTPHVAPNGNACLFAVHIHRSYKQKHLKNVTIFPSTRNTSFLPGAFVSSFHSNEIVL